MAQNAKFACDAGLREAPQGAGAGAVGAAARQAQRRLRRSDFLGFGRHKKPLVLRTASWRFLGIPYGFFRSPFFSVFLCDPGATTLRKKQKPIWLWDSTQLRENANAVLQSL